MGHISQVTVTNHSFTDKKLNQIVYQDFNWIGMRAQRHFWSCLFTCNLVTSILTCGIPIMSGSKAHLGNGLKDHLS